MVIGHSLLLSFFAGTSSLLRLRLLSAAVIIAVLVSLSWLDFQRAYFGVAGVWLAPVMLLVILMATEEVLSLFAAKGWRPIRWPIYAGNLLLGLAACGPIGVLLWRLDQSSQLAQQMTQPLGQLGLPLLVLSLGVCAVFAAEMQRFRGPGQASLHAAIGIFTLVYVGVLYGFMAHLRMFHDHGWGMVALLSLLVIVKMADTGAYFTGRFLGRHKMSPLLSPKKTIEGAIGGIVTACIASWACFRFLGPPIVGSTFVMPSALGWLAYGLVIAAAGMVGDLAESLLKRDMEVKDSSTWLPGLGGVLDIIDSVLIAGPVAYVCWGIGIVGPGV